MLYLVDQQNGSLTGIIRPAYELELLEAKHDKVQYRLEYLEDICYTNKLVKSVAFSEETRRKPDEI